MKGYVLLFGCLVWLVSPVLSAPSITIISPSEGAVYNTSEVSLLWTVNETLRWVGYSLDGGSNVTISPDVDDSEDSWLNISEGLVNVTQAVDENWSTFMSVSGSGWRYFKENYSVPNGTSAINWTAKFAGDSDDNNTPLYYWNYSASNWTLLSAFRIQGNETETISIPADGFSGGYLVIMTAVTRFTCVPPCNQGVPNYYEGRATFYGMFNKTLSLSCGRHNVSVYGNNSPVMSSSGLINFTVDVINFVPPSPGNNTWWNSTNAVFNVSLEPGEASNSCYFYVNDSGTNVTMEKHSPTSFSINYTFTMNGTHSYNASCGDCFSRQWIIRLNLTSPDVTPADRFNMYPVGVSLSSSTSSVTFSLNTNEPCTCRYDSVDVVYGSLSKTFAVTGGTLHTQTESVSPNTVTVYYVRCNDSAGNVNNYSVIISWSVDATHEGGSSVGDTEVPPEALRFRVSGETISPDPFTGLLPGDSFSREITVESNEDFNISFRYLLGCNESGLVDGTYCSTCYVLDSGNFSQSVDFVVGPYGHETFRVLCGVKNSSRVGDRFLGFLEVKGCRSDELSRCRTVYVPIDYTSQEITTSDIIAFLNARILNNPVLLIGVIVILLGVAVLLALSLGLATYINKHIL